PRRVARHAERSRSRSRSQGQKQGGCVSWRVRYSPAARVDLKRLYGFLLEHDIAAARRALTVIIKSTDLLWQFPFTRRNVDADHPLLRELLVPFGASCYVLLYEIENDTTITILAVRHQREDDYHRKHAKKHPFALRYRRVNSPMHERIAPF